MPETSVGESCAPPWLSGKQRSKRCWACAAVSNRSYRLPNPSRHIRHRTGTPAAEALLQRVTGPPDAAPSTEFIVTKEYLRFVEFCDACRGSRYIGLCYGVPGVGKTVSARHYSHWSELETLVGPPPYRYSGIPGRESGPWRTVLYTPGVVNTPRIIQRDVEAVWAAVFGLADRLHQPSQQRPRASHPIAADRPSRSRRATARATV